LVTVEVDQVLVESRLTAGGVPCPDCPGVLAPWGWARQRGVRGVGVLRPRRGRCVSCLVTHVLLPVTALLRRADAAAVIGAAITRAKHDRRTKAYIQRRRLDKTDREIRRMLKRYIAREMFKILQTIDALNPKKTTGNTMLTTA